MLEGRQALMFLARLLVLSIPHLLVLMKTLQYVNLPMTKQQLLALPAQRRVTSLRTALPRVTVP